jgi:hypothetical protein
MNVPRGWARFPLEEHRGGHIESLAQFINVIFVDLALSI